MKNTDKQTVIETLKVIGTLGGALIFVTISAWIFTAVQKQQGVVTQTIPANIATSTPSDYQLKDDMREAIIITNFKNSVSDNVPSGKISKTLKVTGNFADGYLYVVANVNGKALQTTDPAYYDAVFTSLVELTTDGSDSEFGGHLMENKSLETPNHNNYTELLYKLSDVVYKKKFTDPDTVLLSGNWLSILNDHSKREKIVSFSSTIKGTGTIEKLVLYYKCADGSNCSITTE